MSVETTGSRITGAAKQLAIRLHDPGDLMEELADLLTMLCHETFAQAAGLLHQRPPRIGLNAGDILPPGFDAPNPVTQRISQRDSGMELVWNTGGTLNKPQLLS